MTASTSALAINGEQVNSGQPTAGSGGDKRGEALQSKADALAPLAALRVVARLHLIAAKPATLAHRLFSNDKLTTNDLLCAVGGLGSSGKLRNYQCRAIRTYAPGETAACFTPRWPACFGQLCSKVKPLTSSSKIRSRLLRPEIQYRISDMQKFKNILFQEESELSDVIGQHSNRGSIISNAPLSNKPDRQIRILPSDAIRKTTQNKQVWKRFGTSPRLTWISLERRTLEGVDYAVGGTALRAVNGSCPCIAMRRW